MIFKKQRSALVSKIIRITEIGLSYGLWLWYISGYWVRLGTELSNHGRASWLLHVPAPEGAAAAGEGLSDGRIMLHAFYFVLVTISHIGLGT